MAEDRSHLVDRVQRLLERYRGVGYDDEALWQAPNAELEQLARRELAATGLTRDAAVLNTHVVRIRRSYPVYRRGYKAHVKVIADHLATVKGLHAIGRYGSFKYNNQDHSLLMGILAADAIAGSQARRAEHRDVPATVWAVNTALEYQEG